MLDAIVQLIRNGLCCVKDLHLFGDSFLYDASLIRDNIVDLSFPYNKTTPLEVAIGIAQFYAFISISFSGYRLIFDNGIFKQQRIETLMKNLEQKQASKQNKDDRINDLIQERLEKELVAAKKSTFMGYNVLAIGIGFFWFFANSFHITETPYVGGMQGLIHALTAMEIGLVPLLYYMIVDGIELIGRAARMQYLSAILKNCTDKVPPAVLTDETVHCLFKRGWKPFWANGIAAPSKDTKLEQDNLTQEVQSLVSLLEVWVTDKDNTTMKETIAETAERLQVQATECRYEAYREFIYFVLNFIAFYGYMLGALTFYFQEQDENEQSVYVRTLKLGMSNSDADWRGNFAGDLMWTIEPIIILGSPVLVKWWGKRSNRQQKAAATKEKTA